MLSALFVAVALSLSACGYVQPDEKFLKSNWMFNGTDVAMGTVDEFVEEVKNGQMTNGKHFEVVGWKKNDNVYTLHVKGKDSIEIRFSHILASPSNGANSTFDAVTIAGQELPPFQFYQALGASQAVKPATNESPSNAAAPSQPMVVTNGQPESSASAQAVSSIERDGPCQGLDLAVTAMRRDCLLKKLDVADSQLNDVYKRTFANLSSDRKAALKAEEISWISEKEDKCNKAGKEAKDAQMELVLAADCKLQMTESRVAYLTNYK